MGIFIQAIIEAFKLIFTLNPEILSITLLSLKVSSFAVLFSCLIGIPLALIISHNTFPVKKIIIAFIHTGMAIPPVVVGLIVYILLSRNGPLGYLELLYTPGAMMIAQILLALPVITGISLTAFNSVKKKTRETVISLGAKWYQYGYQMIREARYGLITALITGFGAVISEVGAIILVGGNIRFHTRALTTSIVLETQKGEFAMAMALGFILLGLAFLITFILTYIQQKKSETEN
ncbi:MAG: ABC transporter permease [Candidatus Woesearchaeota archaeon]|jgi:tungstate transport system permease protein